MKLSFNPRSGHIKRDGAVVGAVVEFKRHIEAQCKICSWAIIGETAEELLGEVRQHMEGHEK